MRIAQFDITERAKPFPAIITQLLFALTCTLAAIISRNILDLYLPGAGPFILTIPFVMVATLFGRLFSGLICQTITGLHAWYFVLPMEASFAFEKAADGPRTAVNLIVGYFVVAMAEVFRRAVRQAMNEREMLLLELEHRVKNNFASIASVLRLQLRELEGPAALAIQGTLGRVESYAQAYELLYHNYEKAGNMEIGRYLTELCRSLETASISGHGVVIACETDRAEIARERAIAIGLLVNEVTTNSLKHAFRDGRKGRIDVRFMKRPKAFELTIADNGSGFSTDQTTGGLGMKLIKALVVQADGEMEVESGEEGTVFRFSFGR